MVEQRLGHELLGVRSTTSTPASFCLATKSRERSRSNAAALDSKPFGSERASASIPRSPTPTRVTPTLISSAFLP